MSALSRKLKRLASTTSAWLADESSDVESTYVAKPRYHHTRKSRKLVRWFTYITSDLQRLTAFTLIVVLVCGLGTVALLNLLGSPADQRVIIKEDPAPDESSLNTENDLQSSTPDQPESSSRLPDVRPLADDGPRQKEAVARSDIKSPKQESEVRARPDQSARSASVSGKSAPSTNVVRAEKADASRAANVARAEKGDASSAKAVPSPLVAKSSTNTQRPRRVTGKNDRTVPVATSGKSNKAKVIQWP